LKKSYLLIIIVSVVLIADQLLKFYIKTHYSISGGFDILGLPWAKIHFVENEGMAFGLKFGGVFGKYLLSIFRILMVIFLIYLLRSMIKTKESLGLQISFSLIIAGAIGNIIDSAFYGMIFSESGFHSGIATLFPDGGGYGSFLQGKVVDMFYFPMINSTFPDWFPIWGGERFQFFRPVFNIADSSISIGVVLILLFHRSYFVTKKPEEATEKSKSDEEE